MYFYELLSVSYIVVDRLLGYLDRWLNKCGSYYELVGQGGFIVLESPFYTATSMLRIVLKDK